ncbi:hypothetical protein NliqN6_5100 [Naganishia liquefaciens]|uniref:Protein CPL1-like domain-containing protein n=1 Tax=Naganishia liquefaciens TaxID=104408 RepID=A0A8H3TXL5_9TREE|nr:hypothetical protein NliqN6_5100 [Naganishia liquefaciens]
MSVALNADSRDGTGSSPASGRHSRARSQKAISQQSRAFERSLKADGCQTVAIQVPAEGLGSKNALLTLIPSICLCIQNGVLTPNSLSDLEGAVFNSKKFRTAEAYFGREDMVVEASINMAQTELAKSALTCDYAENLVPSCAKHSTTSYQYSGHMCYASVAVEPELEFGESISSHVPAEKPKTEKPSRRGLQAKNKFCTSGLTACEMSGISLQDGRSPKSLACIDTQSDIEACGGCPFAGSASVQGDDCTEMQGVDEVICNRGRCEALSCMRGFTLSGTECIETGYTPFWSRRQYA